MSPSENFLTDALRDRASASCTAGHLTDTASSGWTNKATVTTIQFDFDSTTVRLLIKGH